MPRERLFPDGSLEIVLQLDADYRPALDGPSEPFPVLSVGGIRTASHTIENSGRPVRVLGIGLWPAGAYALLRTSLRELTDLDLDLHDVIGRAAAEFGTLCWDAHGDAACVGAAVEWMRARIGRAPEPAALVARTLAQIEADGGDLLIAALDGFDGKAGGRFAAAFRDQVGVTPKRFARIVRFRRALELVRHGEASLAEIAGRTGYYDQPHMNAEFRVHAGMSPQAFRRAVHYPNSVSLAEQNLQDEVATSA